MILFDLIDEIFRFIIKFIPAGIAIVSIFIAYYYYKINDPSFCKEKKDFEIGIIPTKNMIPKKEKEDFTSQYLSNKNHNSENFTNYFCKRGCKLKNKRCEFDLIKNVSFKCPDEICFNKESCKENFTNSENLFGNNYYCFNGIDCIEKKYDYLRPSRNNCGEPIISQVPKKIYKSKNKCYDENIKHIFYDKNKCLKQPHGYGWLSSQGCIKGNPGGPNDISLDYTLHGSNKFIPSNPDAYILPEFDFKYNPTLY